MYELIGDRITVLLDKQPDHTKSSSGLEIPLFYNAESDGGKPIAKVSDKQYLSKGTIQAISPYAAKKLEELGASIKVGDRVFVNPNTVSANYQFFTTRHSLVQDFEGVICVSHQLIEAKIPSNEN